MKSFLTWLVETLYKVKVVPVDGIFVERGVLKQVRKFNSEKKFIALRWEDYYQGFESGEVWLYDLKSIYDTMEEAVEDIKKNIAPAKRDKWYVAQILVNVSLLEDEK